MNHDIEAVLWDPIDDHECLYTLYSHTSYRDGKEQDVFYCTFPRCPNWAYGPERDHVEEPTA